MPGRYVKPYVHRGKSDALDAEAICEAVSRPTMRFATIKTLEQQAVLTLHRSREILVKQQTMLANLIRGCLGEFGIVAPVGIRRVAELIAVIKDDADPRILPEARIAMRAVADQLCDLQKRIKQIEQAVRARHRSNEASRRLATIPGVGSITASAIVATVANATEFKSARHFAAFLGLTPKQCSTGGRQRLGRISKQGDVYIRRLLIFGRVQGRLADASIVGVRLSELRLRRPRQWGGCWLALMLWRELQLDQFWSKRLGVSRKGTHWGLVLFGLGAYRLLAPGSEWRLHREWFQRSALADLLGEDARLAEIHKLYRCHDRLVVHKQAVFDHLVGRWRDLFNISYDVLLYALSHQVKRCLQALLSLF